MIELGEFRTQGANRTPVTPNLWAIHGHHLDESVDTFGRRMSLRSPGIQHRLRLFCAQSNDRFKNFVLGLKVVVESPTAHTRG